MRTLTLGVWCFASALLAPAATIATLPGLVSVDFIEGTGVATTFTFASNSTQLNTRLTGTLSTTNSDFNGLSNENYDVFYSNADGTFNTLGEFISIEAAFGSTTSSGLNIDSVRLNFSGGATQFAGTVPSFAGGAGYVSGSELNILGATNGTYTAMGRTTGTDRMRVTVGFVPEPGTWALMGSAVGLLGLLRRRRQHELNGL